FMHTVSSISAIYALSPHDALPISGAGDRRAERGRLRGSRRRYIGGDSLPTNRWLTRHRDSWRRVRGATERQSLSIDPLCGSGEGDRKSTRLNSSHDQISYAVFCLK